MTRLSVRMLRHYDAQGVLVPAQVDQFTGYRRYAMSQLADAHTIRQLRDVGFSVSAIAALLAARGTEAFQHALSLQRDVLVAETRAAQQKLTSLDSMLDQLKENTMSISIKQTTLPAMTVVSLRGTIPTYSDEGQLWARFMPELAKQGIRPVGPGGTIEHDDQYMEANPTESVLLPVAAGTQASAPLEVFELPEQRALCATITGPWEQITEAHGRLGEMMAAEGLEPAERDEAGLHGKVLNIYFNNLDQVAEADLVTEVYRPVR